MQEFAGEYGVSGGMEEAAIAAAVRYCVSAVKIHVAGNAVILVRPVLLPADSQNPFLRC